MKFKYAILFIIACVMVAPISALFTPTFSENETAHYNISYVNAPSGAIPLELPIFLAIVGIVMLLLSFVLVASQGRDVVAWLSPVPLLISSWQFLNVDIVTGYGSAIISLSDTNFTVSLLESHMIYAMYPEAVFTFIVFIISLLNIYRVTSTPEFDYNNYNE